MLCGGGGGGVVVVSVVMMRGRLEGGVKRGEHMQMQM
jgi:hypothetical protein